MKTIAHGGNLRASSGREFPRSPRARGRSRSEHRTPCRRRCPRLMRGPPGRCPRPGCPTSSDVRKRLPWATRGEVGAEPGAGTPRARGWAGALFRPARLPQRADGRAAGPGRGWRDRSAGRERGVAGHPIAPGPGTSSAEPRAPPPPTARLGGEGPGLPVPVTLEDCRPAVRRRDGQAGCTGAAAPRAWREAAAAAGFPVGTSVRVRVCLWGANAAHGGSSACADGGPGTLSGRLLPSCSSPLSFRGRGPVPAVTAPLGSPQVLRSLGRFGLARSSSVPAGM